MGIPAPRTAVQRGRDVNERLTLLERAMARLGFIDRDAMAHAGDVKMTARATAPSGWLICQGQSLLRSEYPALFEAIGDAYGAVDADHFSLPDLRGRVAVGQDANQAEFDEVGEQGGEKTHTLSVAEMPQHSHDYVYLGNSYGSFSLLSNTTTAQSVGFGAGTNWAPERPISIGKTGGGGAHNNLQPYIVLNYLIKA